MPQPQAREAVFDSAAVPGAPEGCSLIHVPWLQAVVKGVGTMGDSAARGRWSSVHLAPGPRCASAPHRLLQPRAWTALGLLAARASALPAEGQSQLPEVR